MSSLMQRVQGVFSEAIDRLIDWSKRVGRDPISEACTTIARGEPLSREMVVKLAVSLKTMDLLSKWVGKGSLGAVLTAVPNFDQVQLDNRCACLPLLRQAVESQESGSPTAQQEYERRRLTHIDFLPTYAQILCEDVCKRECTKVQIKLPRGSANTQQATTEIKRFIQQIAPNRAIDGQQRRAPVTILGFGGCFSYESARMLLEILSPKTRKNEFSLKTEGSVTVIIDRFCPASDGPLGAAAAAAWQQMSKIALASVVLEDLLSGLPFQISEDIKRRAIERSIADKGSPWAIADSRLVKNARALHELYESGKLSQKGLAVAINNRDTMFSQYIEVAVGDIEHTQTTKAKQGASAQASEPVAEEPTATSRAAESCIGNPKWEFYRAIHSAQPDQPFNSNFRQQHSALYRIYRTTDISLQECVDLVRQGADAEARFVRIEEKKQQQQQLVMPQANKYSPPATAEADEEADAALESSIEAPYTITGDTELLQSSWFQGLDATYKKLVENRLARVKEGNFGHWRRLELEGVAVCELQFHRGAGQRVYFRFTGPNSIELLDAGSKGDQERILRRWAK